MIQSVARISTLLGAFTADRPELTLSECSSATGLSKSSAHRLLTSLEEVQLVERNGMRWRLGPRVVWLATVRLGHLDLRREASRRLRAIAQRFHAATAFSMPNGSEMIYLDRFESQEAFGVNARLGAIAPIWAGASGRAILMRLPDADRMARLDVDGWRALDPSVREEVLDEIAEGQRTGYCLEHTSRFFPGVGGVAVPLADVDGTPVAAISVVLPPSELAAARATEIAAALLELAHELEAQYAPAQPVES